MNTVERRIVFESETFRVGHVVARPSSPECGEIESQGENVVVLPITGMFAKHDGPRQQVIVTPNNAVLLATEKPYRISYPAGIGDKCLTLRFSDDVARRILPQAVVSRGSPTAGLTSFTLLPPSIMLARSLLHHRLATIQDDRLAIEELTLNLFVSTLSTMLSDERSDRFRERTRTIEAVKEAITANPERKWTLEDLARIANCSPYHLSHIFRQKTGAPVYRFVLRTRLAKALEAVLDSDGELTEIALEAGFASHSHFTSRFHEFFGVTPRDLRRSKGRALPHEVRKIVIAHRIGRQ